MKKVAIMVFVTVSLIAAQAISGDFKGSIKMGFGEKAQAVTSIEQVKISIEQAIEIAKKRVDGRVFEAELEKEYGYLVWDIDILDKNKEKHEIVVDPVTGDVLLSKKR